VNVDSVGLLKAHQAKKIALISISSCQFTCLCNACEKEFSYRNRVGGEKRDYGGEKGMLALPIRNGKKGELCFYFENKNVFIKAGKKNCESLRSLG